MNLKHIAFLFMTIISQTYGDEPIQDLTAFYKLDKKESVKRYQELISTDRRSQLMALDFFSKNKCYRIIALALDQVDPSLKPSVIDKLADSAKGDTVIIKALLKELEVRNFDMVQGGEDLAAHLMTRKKLIAIISKLSNISDSGINPDNKDQVSEFIKLAKNSLK